MGTRPLSASGRHLKKTQTNPTHESHFINSVVALKSDSNTKPVRVRVIYVDVHEFLAHCSITQTVTT